MENNKTDKCLHTDLARLYSFGDADNNVMSVVAIVIDYYQCHNPECKQFFYFNPNNHIVENPAVLQKLSNFKDAT